jgi:hypothetical protein
LSTAIVGIFSYRNQKEADRQSELSKEQREAYADYIQSYFDWSFTEEGTAEDEKVRNNYRQAYFKLFTIASDSFLKAAMSFHRYVWSPPFPDFSNSEDRDRVNELWTDVLIEMRKDAHLMQQLTRGDQRRMYTFCIRRGLTET